MLELYNTLTKEKEEFKPIVKGAVGMYSCGPTVYNFAHIGNFRNYIFVDLLKRYLKFKGFKVKHIMNLTDIDDKTIRDSEKEGLGLKEFTEKYTAAFFDDIKALNIEPASQYPKATEHVNEMVDFVKVLVKKGFAYEKLGSVYFDISQFTDYGKLSKIDLSQMKAGARVDLDEYEKDHPGDFTLLKKSRLDELRRGVYYDTEFGKVRPGWHLECSVMSMKYLGSTFDIHCGGIDLVFPHHENEIAQSEAYSGKRFVNYWLHNEHLVVDGKKMSKSLGNFYTLRDVLSKGYDPRAVRYLLLSTHYRQKLNFTFDGLDAAKKAIERFDNFIFVLRGMNCSEDIGNIDELIKEAKAAFSAKMDDDLNISEASAVIFDFIRDTNKLRLSKKDADKVLKFMEEVDKVFGVIEFSAKVEKISGDIQQLIDEREEARKNKAFKKADEIRDRLKKEGIELIDTKEGVRWKRIS
ncbi:MAG: cysteine--tRNA ligase [Nanoarchaeota archaeon]|nr:cysteine--tRNA ligase [Nanoarchaeota archaeon]MBU1947076.1 cysteine--tRNA ligase [Nanoarchaeota archaeon]